MTIKRLFSVGFGLFVFFLVGLMATSVMMNHSLDELARREAVRRDSLAAANELKASSQALTTLGRTYVVTGDSSYEAQYWRVLDVRNGKAVRPDGRTIPLKQIMTDLGFTEAEFAKLKEAEDRSNGLVALETEAMNAVKGLFPDASGAYTRKGEPDFKRAQELMFGPEYHKHVANIMEPIDTFFEMLGERTEASVEEQLAWSGTLMAVAIGTIVVLIAAVAGMALTIHVRVTRPIEKLQAEVERIGDGDLTRELSASGRDEVSALTRGVGVMAASLRDVVTQVASASREVASAATQIAASNEEVAKSADEQSAQVTQISAAVEEMSASVIEVARKSSEAAGNASEAGKLAGEGGTVVQQTIQGMNAIAGAVQSGAQSVRELGKRGEQIGQIIAVINDIADQTNLLALNAAIEAARAGEHGRGFAVVADEVRKLADRTTKATDEIGQSIRAIQSETTSAVAGMDAGTREVEQGVAKAGEAGRSLEKIVASAKEVATVITSIAAAAEEQSAAAQQVSQSIGNVTAAAQQTREATGQAATAATQLSNKAEQLLALMNRFRIEAGKRAA